MPWAVQASAVARATTSELFPALDRSARVVTLQQLFDAAPGEALPLGLGLQLGAAVAERVAVIHAAGRRVGALDASRVRISVDGRVSLSRTGEGRLAPEMVAGGVGSFASDVYAVAHMSHQMLTGSPPLSVAVPPSRFNPQLDSEVDAVMLAALREQPEERPASVMALQAALEGLAEELGLGADPHALGKIVEKLFETGVQAPRVSLSLTLADRWLADPGPSVGFDEVEEEPDEPTSQTEQQRPGVVWGVYAAAALAMLTTAVAFNRAAPAEHELSSAALVAPPAPRHETPAFVAVATAPKLSTKHASAPPPPAPARHRHRHHR